LFFLENCLAHVYKIAGRGALAQECFLQRFACFKGF